MYVRRSRKRLNAHFAEAGLFVQPGSCMPSWTAQYTHSLAHQVFVAGRTLTLSSFGHPTTVSPELFPSRRNTRWSVATKGGHTSRRLYDCVDCIDAWDNVCDEGVPSVCKLVGYGSPITAVGVAAISTVCDTLGAACSASGGEEACAGQCEDVGGGDDDSGKGENCCRRRRRRQGQHPIMRFCLHELGGVTVSGLQRSGESGHPCLCLV